MQRHGAFRSEQVLHEGADTHPAIAQPDDARLVYPPVFDLDHLVVLVKVIAGRIGLGNPRTVKRDHLPFVVEHRRAAASLRRVTFVDQDIRQIVVDDFVVAQRDLFFLAIGVLNDGRVVARARLSQPAIQDEVALVTQMAQAGQVAWTDGDQGQVKRLRGVQERFWVQRMDHRVAQPSLQVVFVAELDGGVISQRCKFGDIGHGEHMVIGHHEFR